MFVVNVCHEWGRGNVSIVSPTTLSEKSVFAVLQFLSRYADYLGVLVGAVRGGIRCCGTILYKKAGTSRGLQF